MEQIMATSGNEEKKRKFRESDFRIEQMKEEYFDEMMILVKESFATREPLINGLQLDKEEVFEYLKDLSKEWITYQPSVCAVYIPENKIVGVNFTKILTRKDQDTFNEDSITHYTPKVQTLIKILIKIESSFNVVKEDEKADKVLEIALLGVDKDFSGNKLAYRMNEESERIALELGCRIITTQASNKTSQHIFRKLGFQDRFSLDYENVEVDGIKPLDISAMNGTTGAIVFVKHL